MRPFHSTVPATRRRGIVLVLILGMLALLALIGVMFAVFSGQASLSGRMFAESVSYANQSTESDRVLDFALSQLINDTDNPLSAIRGHSLARDMYGNDAQFNGHLEQLPNGGRLLLVAYLGDVNIGGVLYPSFRTNINVNMSSDLYGLNFTRWILRINAYIRPGTPPTYAAAQTLEILQDGIDGGGNHVIVTSQPNLNPQLAQPAEIVGTTFPFVLDGEHQRAFNGPGLSPFTIAAPAPYPGGLGASVFGNFLYNGNVLSLSSIVNPNTGALVPPALGNPDLRLDLVTGSPTFGTYIPLPAGDEDYDSPDIENWYLGLQSADGRVVIPSFHRPGILVANPNVGINDWTDMSAASRSKILRPRAVDHPAAGQETFPDLLPGADGTITYDVDNDGDGITDAVWLDLGYPPQRDPFGRTFKPLFAITVLGLNGRMPLNTAGNLQARNPDGTVAADHVSGVGYSANEINPKFAFSAPLTGNAPSVDPLDTGQFMLQRVLQGFWETTGKAIAGRWGEEGLLNAAASAVDANRDGFNDSTGQLIVFPRAGRSNDTDGADDDSDALDFTSPQVFAFDPTAIPESHEVTDVDLKLSYVGVNPSNAGRTMLPSERMRRFLWPLNTTGNGRVVSWNEWNWDPNAPTLTFYLPYLDAVALTSLPPATPLPIPGGFVRDAFDYGHGHDSHGRVSFFQFFRPPGVPLEMNAADAFIPAAVPNRTNNPYHVFEGFRNPVQQQMLGAQPVIPPYATAVAPTDLYNTNVAPMPSGTPGLLPTFTLNVLTAAAGGVNTTGLYYGGSLNRDEADEMNVYEPSAFDAPFGASDLEWLYRFQDSDGTSLSSRLDTLGQVVLPNTLPAVPEGYNIFTNTRVSSILGDPRNAANNLGITRRRLFSLDAWEMSHYAWTNDNPGGFFANNSRFLPADSANEDVLSVRSGGVPVLALPLAHGGDRINLNFPFPPSNNPSEPVRQRWVTEAYALAKTVLPPKAIDTPVELARLSQFIVNIVDFRDPDGALTRFQNPDLRFVPATAGVGGTPALVEFENDGDPNTEPFVQFGMEYLPVALNEVLATKFKTHTQGSPTNYQSSIRLFIELVNLNTDDAAHDTGDLNLDGWQMVILPDTVTGRPDPVRGFFSTANAPTGANAPRAIGPRNAADPVRAMGLGGNPNYYVLSNIPQVGNIADNTIDSTDNHPPGSHDGGAGAPTNTNDPALPAELVYQLELNEQGNVDALVDPNDATTETGRYSWLYLLRPANPLDPASEKVIVDSMRFVYVAGGGGITYDPMSDTHTVTDNDDLRIYSTARRQPLRGNQSVPGEEAALPSNQQRTPKFAYGYSDGTAYSEDDSPGGPAVTIHGRFTGRQNGAQQLFEMTDPWHQSLGAENEPDDDWNLFPFFDRDFSSPAELLLVPGVSPGLFTKQFVDQERIFLDDDPDPGYVTGSGNTPLATPVLDDDPDDIEPQGDGIGAAPVFPYLPENFYYTPSNDPADNDPTPTVAPNENAVIGGPTSMGWHKLLEWFEVPSSTLGAIGTMADGQNLDWLRRDVRPGQINLNLVIDEEVFFGIIDDARLNRGAIVNPGVPPSVVTLTQPDGTPAASYQMLNRGYYDTGTGQNAMKQAFADFLKLRSGGWSPTTTATRNFMYGLLPDHPYRALSFPDIQYTVMRPALPIPAADEQLQDRVPFVSTGTPLDVGQRYLDATFATEFDNDPMNPDPRLVTAITPPRRFFQIPDAPDLNDPANSGTASIWAGVTYPALALPDISLVDYTVQNTRLNTPGPGRFLLGGDRDEVGGNGIPNFDRRRHPLWRTEWLQKIMNLTTPRTHQYAVWITVGFFEVVRPGNPQMASVNPDLAIDRLGPELDKAAGRNVRYRGFFLLDRTRTVGFNPANPGDFRDVITYRRRIQ